MKGSVYMTNNTNFVAIAFINGMITSKLIPACGSENTTYCELKTVKGFLKRLASKKYNNNVVTVKIFKYYDYDKNYNNDNLIQYAIHTINNFQTY